MFTLSKVKSLILRFLSIASKFLFIFYISKEFKPDIVGQYSIFVTTVLMCVFVVGADFYTYSSRKIINTKSNTEKEVELAHQFIFYLISYSVFLVLFQLFFNEFNIIKKEMYFLFLLIVFVEHLSQEIYRIFNTINKPEIANIILFIRSGVWVFVVIMLNEFFIIKLNLSLIYVIWLTFSGLSVVIGFMILSKSYNLFKVSRNAISFSKIKYGLQTSFVFFLGTILYKVVEFANRYIIEDKLGEAQTGIYSFYSNISNVLVVFVDVVIFSYSYPKIIEAYSSKEFIFKSYIKKLLKHVFILSLLTSTGLLIGTFVLINYYSVFFSYKDGLSTLPILLIGNFFLNMSLLYHYAIYAQEKDNILLKSMVITCIINIITNYYFVPIFGIKGGAWSQAVSFLFLFLFKLYVYQRTLKNDN